MHSESDIKLSHKGVSKKIKLDGIDYLKCLYDNDPGEVSYGFIQISKKVCKFRWWINTGDSHVAKYSES